ncbi:MAG: Bacterial Ig-like domain [Planctomycetota bacterium]
MQLLNCSLGCSSTGCLRSDIAQNETIILQFTNDVDPSTVGPSTIQFRTASGEQPVGEFFVNDNQVEFVPSLRLSGGQTFYGFTPGETYTMTILGGEGQSEVLRSTSGHAFGATLTCTLESTLGIVDLNGAPPSARLITPNSLQLTSAPRDTVIQLEFNEIIDATPFLSGTSPVIFSVRRTRDAVGGGRECDSGSQPLVLSGGQRVDFLRDKSILTFTPAATLPPNVCIEISVTDGVVDLSGRPAQPQTYSFVTEIVPLVEDSLVENFDNDAFLDPDASAATWAAGIASFAKIGGDGRHGSFVTSIGQDLGLIGGKRTYLINTDSALIPASQSVTGAPVAVTDGRFFFDTMVVPSDVRLRFTGSNPPVFTVVGKLQIDGEIDVQGASLTTLPSNVIAVGQTGATGGVFGGQGGQGGDKCLGTGFNPNYNGRDGQAARVRGGHGYATSTAATAGRGSQLFPVNGLSTSLVFGGTSVAYTPSAAAGGSGGGFLAAGDNGRVVTNNHIDPVLLTAPRLDAMGPQSTGGSAMPLFPILPFTGQTVAKSSDHFLIGGSGGGGGGSHACLTIALARVWAPGGGGGGGGGAIALRAGNQLTISPTGSVLANGGNAASIAGVTSSSSPAPGGGGSGGSIVLQSGNSADLSGLVNVQGGNGGTFNRSANGSPNQVPFSAAVTIQGGNGSAGFVRCELPTAPSTSIFGNMLPAPIANNVGQLDELDSLSSFRSKFYSTGLLFGPEYARYEIYATVDGQPVVYSDDPAVSTLAATTGAALRVQFQAANIDITTSAVSDIRAWRTSVRSTANETGIASDGLNGFRFRIIQDRAVGQVVTIDRVVVVYRVAE